MMKHTINTTLGMVLLVTVPFMLFSCHNDEEQTMTDEEYVEKAMDDLSLRDKIAQMIIIRPEALEDSTISMTPEYANAHAVTDITSKMNNMSKTYPVGGIYVSSANIKNESQLSQFTTQIHHLANSPFVCITEEGGSNVSIAGNSSFSYMKYASLAESAQNGTFKNVYDAGNYIGTYLRYMGINVNLAPSAEVSDWEDATENDYHFTCSIDSACQYVTNYVKGMKDCGVSTCLLHFPGYSGTYLKDGKRYSSMSWAEMQKSTILTYSAGIAAGTAFVMVSDITPDNGNNYSGSAMISEQLLSTSLRKDIGYKGIIMTDALETADAESGITATNCINAGADMIFLPSNYVGTIKQIYDDVKSGKIPLSRINESVKRILLFKHSYGLY